VKATCTMVDRIKAQWDKAYTGRTGPMSKYTCSTLDMVCSVSDRFTGISMYDNCMRVGLRAAALLRRNALFLHGPGWTT
jgi:hypothetical protein